MSWYVINSLCRACYISEYIYLHIFRVNFLLKRHLSRGHGISCLAHHLERTDNKPFSRLIGPTHKQVGQLPIKTGWWDAHLGFCNLSKACRQNMWQQRYSNPQSLSRKRTLNHFAKLAKGLTCVLSTYLYVIHLNFRYRACCEEGFPWHSGNYRVYIYSEMRTWHDNNIQGLHFPGAIQIVTTVIYYCYCLMAYGKWRLIIWYRMINITFYFSAWKCLKLLGILFILKFYARIGIFTKICIWKSYFWKKRILHLNLTFRTAKNLCPNFQKLLLPSKIPG